MPLPDDATTVTGGCSCGAIRYRISIPQRQDRPLHPMTPPEYDSRLPDTLTCHCNDCRRTTGSFLAVGMADVPAPMLTVSAMSPSSGSEPTIASGRILDVLADDYDAKAADAARPPYLPAADVLRATEGNRSWMRFFHSTSCTPDVSRGFCGRCGSPISFHFKLEPEYCHDGKLPSGWRHVFHLYLGSIDREFLDKDWFAPSAEVNFKLGTPVSRCVSATAKGLKEVAKMGEFDDPVPAEELEKLGV